MRAFARVAAAVTIALAGSLVPASGSVGADAPPPRPDATLQDGRGRPTSRARDTARELRRLEDAWAAAGGTYGYPFWDKAGHRWRTGAISTAMYREYVTGYRDIVAPARATLSDMELETRAARDVRELLVDAAELRLEALRAQEQSLDARIERDRAKNALDADEAVAVDELIAARDEEAAASLQQSYRATRLALDHAQAVLDAAGLARLAEDAFI